MHSFAFHQIDNKKGGFDYLSGFCESFEKKIRHATWWLLETAPSGSLGTLFLITVLVGVFGDLM